MCDFVVIDPQHQSAVESIDRHFNDQLGIRRDSIQRWALHGESLRITTDSQTTEVTFSSEDHARTFIRRHIRQDEP
jgi:hypothetical protein